MAVYFFPHQQPNIYILISSDKIKILVNSIKPTPSTNIQINGQTLEEVDQFKYLGSTQTKDGSSVKEVKIRLAQAHSVLLYGCESWTLTADLERRIQAFGNKCFRRMLDISTREHKMNDYVWQQVGILVGPLELLPSNVASYHGSAMSFAMICCRKSYYRAP